MNQYQESIAHLDSITSIFIGRRKYNKRTENVQQRCKSVSRINIYIEQDVYCRGTLTIKVLSGGSDLRSY